MDPKAPDARRTRRSYQVSALALAVSVASTAGAALAAPGSDAGTFWMAVSASTFPLATGALLVALSGHRHGLDKRAIGVAIAVSVATFSALCWVMLVASVRPAAPGP
jgi:tellurite resistance protein TehA-like permease